MRKMIILIFLSVITLKLTAPENKRTVIVADKPCYIYGIEDPFLRAVIKLESNFDDQAVNPHSGARGILQIMPVMIREVNKYSDIKYTWNDAWNPYKSIEIWDKIMEVKNPEYYPDRACKLWFGSGVQYDGMTWREYYEKVMRKL